MSTGIHILLVGIWSGRSGYRSGGQRSRYGTIMVIELAPLIDQKIYVFHPQVGVQMETVIFTIQVSISLR